MHQITLATDRYLIYQQPHIAFQQAIAMAGRGLCPDSYAYQAAVCYSITQIHMDTFH